MRTLTLSIAAVVGISFMNAPTPAYSAPKQYTLAVGSLGGTMGRLGAGLSNLLNDKQNKYKFSVVPGGGRANPARVGTGGADFGFSFSNLTKAARKGTFPYKKSYKNLRMIAMFWNSCYHQYISKDLYDSGIKTWDDIVASKKPLKLGPSKKGTSSEFFSQLIVKHLGTSYEELTKRGYKLMFAGAGGSSRAISSRNIDMYVHNSGIPNGAGLRAHLSRDLTFMDMSPSVKKMLISHQFQECTIPGGTYKGAKTDKHSMGASGMLLTTDKMSSKTVYNMLKIAHSNTKTLKNVHKIFKKWTPKLASQELGVPMHPGALKYYKEAGTR